VGKSEIKSQHGKPRCRWVMPLKELLEKEDEDEVVWTGSI
jgi:hypothetical protein